MESVDAWFSARETWRDELDALRSIVLGAGLGETLKWRQPCYTHAGSNVVIVSARKDAAVVSFLRGALLSDPDDRLIQPGEHARSARYMPFPSAAAIADDRAYLEALLAEAKTLHAEGRRVEPSPDAIEFVPELQDRLDGDEAFREAFLGLTKGRQRGYNLHIGGAKQADTREGRIDRLTPRILARKGLRDCVCGHSKRPPGCDGSHKHHSGSRTLA